jgi:hypothetical protein
MYTHHEIIAMTVRTFAYTHKSGTRNASGLVKTANMASIPRIFINFFRRTAQISCTAATPTAEMSDALTRKANPVPMRIAHVC